MTTPGWQERLQEAAYTSPSGARFVLRYEELSTQITKKTAVYQTVFGSGQYVQDLGFSGGVFPWRVYFDGDSCDIVAEGFIDALLERGHGTLAHPRHGDVRVVPIGDIQRQENLVNAAGVVAVDVTFAETLADVVGEDVGLASALETYSSLAAADFARLLNVADTADKIHTENWFVASVKALGSGLKDIAKSQENTLRDIEKVERSIVDNIDLTAGTAATIARQTQILAVLPARVASTTTARLSAYASLVLDVLATKLPKPRTYDYDAQNDFAVKRLIGGAALAAAAESLLYTTLQSQGEWLLAAQQIIDAADAYREAIDADAAYTGVELDDETWEALFTVVSGAAGYAVNQSTQAKRRVVYSWSYPRVPIEVAFEIYGTEKQLGKLLTDSSLGGDAAILIPAGVEVVAYV